RRLIGRLDLAALGGQRAGPGDQLLGAVPRPDQVDQHQADADRDRRDDDGVAEHLDAQAAELAEVELGDTHDQRREQERRHQHEQELDEDPTGRLGDVVDDPLERRGACPELVGEDADDRAEEQAEQHLDVGRQPAALVHVFFPSSSWAVAVTTSAAAVTAAAAARFPRRRARRYSIIPGVIDSSTMTMMTFSMWLTSTGKRTPST